MKKALVLLFLFSTSVFAQQAPVREPFPDDYTPSPCAMDADTRCRSFAKSEFAAHALAFRGFDLEQDWIDANWDRLIASFRPMCTKIANCYGVAGNDEAFCLDLMRDDMIATCKDITDRAERERCEMFAMTYFVGLQIMREEHAKAQECARANLGSEPRRLEAFITPAKLGVDFRGQLTVHAYDAETHLPVRAKMTIDGPGALKVTEGPVPATGYPVEWTAKMKRVPAANGLRDVEVPVMTLEAPGYAPLKMTMPIELSRMIVEISPAPSELRRGAKNSVTVTARDAATGKPVWARVMLGNDVILGETNKPFELELPRRGKRPAIWVTSLYDHYGDVIAAPAE